MRGVLFWVNLARKDKGVEPSAQLLQPQDVPVRQEGDATVRVLVGEGSPVELGTPGLILDVELPKGGAFSNPVPSDFNGFVYLLEGEADFGANRRRATPLADRRSRIGSRPDRGRRAARDPVHADGREAVRRDAGLQRAVRGLTASAMTDYGHPITFGLSLYPSVDQLGETRQLARAADEAGLDYLAIQDHAYNPEFLDVWTLITYLAAETERISFVPDVADLQLRPPTILAKAAASLSVLSGGRIVLGVGGGASAGGIAAMGGTRRSGPRDGRVHRGSPADHAPRAGRRRRRVSQRPARRSPATKPDRCHRRRSRSGWAARGRGCWPSPDAPATAGSHRSAPTHRRPRFRPSRS